MTCLGTSYAYSMTIYSHAWEQLVQSYINQTHSCARNITEQTSSMNSNCLSKDKYEQNTDVVQSILAKSRQLCLLRTKKLTKVGEGIYHLCAEFLVCDCYVPTPLPYLLSCYDHNRNQYRPLIDQYCKHARKEWIKQSNEMYYHCRRFLGSSIKLPSCNFWSCIWETSESFLWSMEKRHRIVSSTNSKPVITSTNGQNRCRVKRQILNTFYASYNKNEMSWVPFTSFCHINIIFIFPYTSVCS